MILKIPFVIFALIAKLNLFTVFMVEGPSMEPTLHSGQVFMLDQTTYKISDPKRDDIVVFTLKGKPDYFYVKRVIGLPGEKVSVNSKGVFLHYEGGGEQKLQEPFLGTEQVTAEDAIAHASEEASGQEKMYVVPMDKYFVLGDNRSHSLDSRYFKDNYVSKSDLIGKYLFTLF